MQLFLVAFLLIVVGYILEAAVAKPPKNKPASLEDFDIPQVEEGTPHAVVFGDVWLDGWQVLWYGNYRTSKIKSTGSKK